MRALRNFWQTMPGSQQFIAQVRASCPVEPNFMPNMEMTLATSGKAASWAWIEQVAADRLDAVGLQPRFQPWFGEAGDADDAPLHSGQIRGVAGHAGQRRAHLAGDAKHQQVAVQATQRFDGLRRWFAKKSFQMGNIFYAIHPSALSSLHGVTLFPARIQSTAIQPARTAARHGTCG